MDFTRLTTFSLLLITAVRQVEGGYSLTKAQQLYTQITVTDGYNNLLRPQDNNAISISFTLLSVNYLDIKDQTFSANGWLTVSWIDTRFNWDPAIYDDINYMFVTQTDCWRPELVIDNSVDTIEVIGESDELFRVAASNAVTWEPPGVYTVHCDVDITYYPFDQQDCYISVTSWSYDMSILALAHDTNQDIDLTEYGENGEWTLESAYKVRVEKTSPKNSLDYAKLQFHFIMRRKATYYVLNVLTPVILISYLGLFVFILPAESGEKVGYSLTVLLALAVLMTIVSNTIPTTSKNTSLLGLFLALNLMISALEILVTVIVLRFHHKHDKGIPMSDSTQSFVRDILSRLACRRSCNCITTTTATKREPEEPVQKPRSASRPIKSSGTWRGTKILPTDWDKAEKNSGYVEPEDVSANVPQYTWVQVAEMLDNISLYTLLVIKSAFTIAFVVVLATAV